MEDESLQQPEAATNQTVFGKEEPLFEQTTLPDPPGMKVEKKQPVWKQKKFLIPGIIIVVLILLSSLMFLTPQRRRAQQKVQSPVATPLHPQETAMQQRLDDLKTKLQNADPNKIDLPYPPIQTNISIDQPQN